MGVSILYGNRTIASMYQTGTKTLKTKEKYCDEPIRIRYERPRVSPDMSLAEFLGNQYSYNSDLVMYYNDTPTIKGHIATNFGKFITIDGQLYSSAPRSIRVVDPITADAYLYPDWAQPFEVGVVFKLTNLGGSVNRGLFGGLESHDKNPYMEVKPDGSVWAGWSSDGSSWTNTLVLPIGTVQRNLWYHARYLYDGDKFKIGVSSDFVNYRESETTPSQPMYTAQRDEFCFGGVAYSSYDNMLNDGIINLLGTYIKVNGVLIWGCTYCQDTRTFDFP